MSTYPLTVPSGNTQHVSVNTNSITTTGLAITGGPVTISDTTESTTKDTGCLVVEGGVGVEKNLNVGGSTTSTGVLTVSNTTESSSKDTGAVIIEGGVGVEKNLNIGGTLSLSNLTDSSSIYTGSINTPGGVGIAKKLYVGDVIYATAAVNPTNFATGSIVVTGGVGMSKKLFVGETINTVDTTESTSTSTGSITTSGGIGAAKNIYGLDIYGGIHQKYSCRISRSTTITLDNVTPTTVTGMTHTNTVYDFNSTIGSNEMSTGDGKIYIRKSGNYMLSAGLFPNQTTINTMLLSFLLNNTTTLSWTGWPSLSAVSSHVMVRPYKLTAGDYIELVAYQNSGGTINVGYNGGEYTVTWMSAELIN